MTLPTHATSLPKFRLFELAVFAWVRSIHVCALPIIRQGMDAPQDGWPVLNRPPPIMMRKSPTLEDYPFIYIIRKKERAQYTQAKAEL